MLLLLSFEKALSNYRKKQDAKKYLPAHVCKLRCKMLSSSNSVFLPCFLVTGGGKDVTSLLERFTYCCRSTFFLSVFTASVCPESNDVMSAFP